MTARCPCDVAFFKNKLIFCILHFHNRSPSFIYTCIRWQLQRAKQTVRDDMRQYLSRHRRRKSHGAPRVDENLSSVKWQWYALMICCCDTQLKEWELPTRLSGDNNIFTIEPRVTDMVTQLQQPVNETEMAFGQHTKSRSNGNIQSMYTWEVTQRASSSRCEGSDALQP